MDLEKPSMTSKNSQELLYFIRVSTFSFQENETTKKDIFLSRVYFRVPSALIAFLSSFLLTHPTEQWAQLGNSVLHIVIIPQHLGRLVAPSTTPFVFV